MDKDRLNFVIFLIILSCLFGYAYRGLFNWKMLAMCDLVPWYPTLGETFNSFYYAWSERYMGITSPLAPGEFVVMFFLTLISFGNAIVAQRLFYLSLLPLSAISMYLLLDYMTKSRTTKIIVSLLYALNGITIPWFQAGGYPLLVTHITFPMLMLYLIKIFEEDKSRLFNTLVLCFIFAFIASFYMYMYMVVWFGPFILVFTLSEILSRKSKGYLVRIIPYGILCVALFVLLLAPIITDQIAYLWTYYRNTEGTFGVFVGFPKEYLLESVKFNFTFERTILMFNKYTYLLSICAFLSLFVRKTKNRRYYLNMLIIAVSIILFYRLVSAGIILNLFSDFPILFTLRSPTRLGFMLAWSFLFMMLLLLDELFDADFYLWKRLKTGYKYAAIFVVVIAMVLSSFVLIQSDISPPFDDMRYNLETFFSVGLNPSVADFGEVSQDIEDIRSWIHIQHQNDSFFRTLWVPSDRILNAKILLRYDPQTLKGSPESDMMFLSTMPLISQETENLGEILAYSNVKYVVVYLGKWEWAALNEKYSKNPRIVYEEPFGYSAFGDPQEYVQLLSKQKDLKPIVNNTKFIIYENQRFRPHVSAYNRLLTVAPLSMLHSVPLTSSNVNLVRNAGFDDEMDSTRYYDPIPDWRVPWKVGGVMSNCISDTSNIRYCLDNETTLSGKSSLKVESDKNENSSDIYQIVDEGVTENTEYLFSALIKSKNIGSMSILLYFIDANGVAIKINGSSNYVRLYHKSTEQVSKLEEVIKTLQGSKKVEVHFVLDWLSVVIDKNTTSTVWFDNVALFKYAPNQSLINFDAPPVVSPARNWVYLYGHKGPIEDFPYDRVSGFTPNTRDLDWKYLHGQLLVQEPKLFSKIPNFNSSGYYLNFVELNPEDLTPSYVNISDAIVFFGDVWEDKTNKILIENQRPLLFVYEAESHIFPEYGKWGISCGEQFSCNCSLALFGESNGIQVFFAPRDSHYRVIMSGKISNGTSIKIDGIPLTFRQIRENAGDVGWYESNSIYMEKGEKNLQFIVDGGKEETVLDQVLVLSTVSNKTSFEDIFSLEGYSFDVIENNPSEYTIAAKTRDHLFITLGDSFHNEWKAFTNNNEKLMHVPALPLGWANGFYLDKAGDTDIQIVFGKQKTRTISIVIWLVSWTLITLAIIHLHRKNIKSNTIK